MEPKSEQIEIALRIIKAAEGGSPVEWEYEELPNGSEKWETAIKLTLMEALNFRARVRIKPFVLSDSINGFTLGPGQEWHRKDWEKEMLPTGNRPLLDNELIVEGDELFSFPLWVKYGNQGCQCASEKTGHSRTTRPIPSIVIPVPDGYRELEDSEKDGEWADGAKFLNDGHGWMDLHSDGCFCDIADRIIVPIPWYAEKKAFAEGKQIQVRWEGMVSGHWMNTDEPSWDDGYEYCIAPEMDPYAELKEAYKNGEEIECLHGRGFKKWTFIADPSWMLPPDEYRVRGKQKKIPFSLEDIKPRSVIKNKIDGHVSMIHEIDDKGVVITVDTHLSWTELQEQYQICNLLAPGGWNECEK